MLLTLNAFKPDNILTRDRHDDDKKPNCIR